MTNNEIIDFVIIMHRSTGSFAVSFFIECLGYAFNQKKTPKNVFVFYVFTGRPREFKTSVRRHMQNIFMKIWNACKHTHTLLYTHTFTCTHTFLDVLNISFAFS